jgi:hypothetical protein
MKKRGLYLGLLSILSLGIFLENALGGVVIEQVMRERGGKVSKATLSFSDQRFRTDQEEGGSTVIIDFRKDLMILVNHQLRTYTEMKYSQWEKEVARLLKMESSGVKSKTRKIVVKRAEEKVIVNGFNTEKIDILADGELIEENWVTRDVNLADVEKLMERVARSFSKDFGVEMKEGREIYEKLKPYGFPVLVRDYSMTVTRAPIDRLEVTRIERVDLKEDVFLPPSLYQQTNPSDSQK